ncbi:uncharacterized protein LOC136084780 [Hydra vulgaris]|uniref:Uncharacterized protein LOC136084780 n=1 Tax=Hydra vulgaris TaxID=6087 RepID=A0ABM4CJ25_HYDVU
MALLQTLQVRVKTFGELAEYILKEIINLSSCYGCQRVDFVSDRYFNHSIKSLEQVKRVTHGTSIIRILSKLQPIPRQWKKFLSNGKNKEELINFLFTHWSSLNTFYFSNKSVYLTNEDKCYQFMLSANNVVVSEIISLKSDHEEADTRLMAHCYHAASSHQNIVIWSPDTDVFVIALHAIKHFTVNVLFATGNQNNKRIINVRKVADHWGRSFVNAVVGFHSFTGCDTTSSFYGKGKASVLKVLQKKLSMKAC